MGGIDIRSRTDELMVDIAEPQVAKCIRGKNSTRLAGARCSMMNADEVLGRLRKEAVAQPRSMEVSDSALEVFSSLNDALVLVDKVPAGKNIGNDITSLKKLMIEVGKDLQMGEFGTDKESIGRIDTIRNKARTVMSTLEEKMAKEMFTCLTS